MGTHSAKIFTTSVSQIQLPCWVDDRPILVCWSQNASLWEGSFIFAFSSCSLNWKTTENLCFLTCDLKWECLQITVWAFPVWSFVQIDCWRQCQKNESFKGGDSKKYRKELKQISTISLSKGQKSDRKLNTDSPIFSSQQKYPQSHSKFNVLNVSLFLIKTSPPPLEAVSNMSFCFISL